MSLGANIRELRKLRGLTQEALGAKLELTSQTVSKWERDESMPDAALLPALAGALGCSLDRLFGRATTDFTDAANAVISWLMTAEGEERWRGALRLGCIVQTVVGGFWDDPKNPHSLELFEAPGNVRNLCLREEGFTYSSRKEELPYLVFFPEPEAGWGPLLAGDDPDFWEAMGRAEVRRTIKRFYSGELPGSFDRAWLLENAGDVTEETLAAMVKLGALRRIPARIDGMDTELYRWNSPLTLLTFLLLAADREGKDRGFSTTRRRARLVRKREKGEEE